MSAANPQGRGQDVRGNLSGRAKIFKGHPSKGGLLNLLGFRLTKTVEMD
jgi:hypothetical protein